MSKHGTSVSVTAETFAKLKKIADERADKLGLRRADRRGLMGKIIREWLDAETGDAS